jgi:hypothetical protein
MHPVKLNNVVPIDIGDLQYGRTGGSSSIDILIQELEIRLAIFLRKYSSFYNSSPVKTERDIFPPEFTLGSALKSPVHSFCLDRVLIEKITKISLKKEVLNERDLLILALQNAEGCAEIDFTPCSINIINSLYYSSTQAFDPVNGLADVFINNKRVIHSFVEFFKQISQKKARKIRIKELSSGDLSKWEKILDYTSKGIEYLELADFNINPKDILWGSTVNLAEFDLTKDEFAELNKESRFDVYLATYCFDSVWQKEDARYRKKQGVWYKSKFRIKVPGWHPKKDTLLQSLKKRELLGDVTVFDLRFIFIEEVFEGVDIKNEPLGKLIDIFYKDSFSIFVNFPGGLIKTVKSAFASQLNESGVFIIGDIARYPEYNSSSFSSSLISGVAARYKIEDYSIAKYILEKEDFEVKIMSLGEFVQGYSDDDSGYSLDSSNCIMMVSKNYHNVSAKRQ